jgi:hypothetical protein
VETGLGTKILTVELTLYKQKTWLCDAWKYLTIDRYTKFREQTNEGWGWTPNIMMVHSELAAKPKLTKNTQLRLCMHLLYRNPSQVKCKNMYDLML